MKTLLLLVDPDLKSGSVRNCIRGKVRITRGHC